MNSDEKNITDTIKEMLKNEQDPKEMLIQICEV